MNEFADRVIDLCERHARDWDADRNRSDDHPWIDRPWHERFVAALPGGGARVLDLGCGSGMPVGRYLAESGLLVTGVDASPTLISL
jgi:2-polyprenyl-3-methyl-5-hydroxy-6-metoxy-1,4-benzoquinol methylase